MTQNQLAKKTGISRTSITYYLKGRNLPRVLELIAISNVLNVPIDYLIYDEIKSEMLGG